MPCAWAFSTALFLCGVGISQQSEQLLAKAPHPKEVESVQATHLEEQDEARISREFLALQKCHLNPEFLFLIGAGSMAKQRTGRLVFVQMLVVIGQWEDGENSFLDQLAVQCVVRTRKEKYINLRKK